MVRGSFAVLGFVGLWVVLGPAPTASAQDARAEARVHFTRGVELFDEGRLVEALAEFEEAYRISPAPNLLYNLAQIHADLGHAVEAADAYERFLAEASGIDAELRHEVEAALRTQRARIGRVHVEVGVEGARVFLDDVEIGATPMDPFPVGAGEHVIVVQSAGFETQRHRFRVAGGATYEASLTLVPSGSRGASLRIESRIPGVDVRIDGASMGLTPLDATVPVSAGSHRVEGVREGYVPFALEVSAADGTETRVIVQTRPDESAPTSTRAPLHIAVPSTSTTVRIDGETVTETASLELPVGLHDVEIRAPEREPIDLRIDVQSEGYELDPPYAWTPDARASRLAAADAMRTGGVGTLIPGLVLLAGGIPTLVGSLVWFFDSISPRSQLNQDCRTAATDFDMNLPTCIAFFDRWAGGRAVTRANWIALQNEYNDDNVTYGIVLGIGIGATALGAIATIAGGVLLGSAPSTSDIDRGARSDFTLELDVGLGRLGAHGTF